jgi:hypothetical protein
MKSKMQIFDLAESFKSVFYVSGIDKYIVGLSLSNGYNNVSHFSRGPWGRGSEIGAVYRIDEYAKSRMGNCNIDVGTIDLGCSHLLTHRVDKKDLIKDGDLCVCSAHSGDHFFSFQLLSEDNGLYDKFKDVLFVVNGMDFGAYCFGDPIGKAKLVCLNKMKYNEDARAEGSGGAAENFVQQGQPEKTADTVVGNQ